MAIRTALLNGNNITRDTDFSKYIESVSEPGVIEGLTVTSTKVAIGKARVPCERTNGETIYALVYNTSEVTISGNGDVYIQVSQTYIDDGELANEDGTGIATIQVGTMPSKNALKLATINNGTVTDARNMIPKVGELSTYIQSLTSRMNIVEREIDEIKEESAVDHLEETGLVGELYTLSNTLFKQNTPTYNNCTESANIGDVNDNAQIHIQRIASGTASNKLKLKIKKVGAPTTGLVVEVRRGVEVDVSSTEAYWYGNELVCSGSIVYSGITTDYQEFEVTMNGQFGGTKGELLDIVVYQTGNIVNSTNYYVLGCDSTQYSEGFSYVKVNGTTRTRSKLMPYCIGDGFAQSLLSKVSSITETKTASDTASVYDGTASSTVFTATEDGIVVLNCNINGSSSLSITYCYVQVNGTNVASGSNGPSGSGSAPFTATFLVKTGDVVTVVGERHNYGSGNVSNIVAYYTYATVSDDVIKCYPRKVIGIGELAETTLYGKHSDSLYIGGLVVGTSTSVTTGSITLGNAVGYLTMNYNGQIIKIPYYT